MTITHRFVSAKPAAADPSQVGSTEWNDTHAITFGAGAGDVAEGNHTHTGMGDVVGPSSAVADNFASFNGTGGKTIKDSGSKASDFAAASHVHQLPIGFVFISVDSTNPATSLGYGTWAAFGAGRVLVGLDAGDPNFDVVEETGGAKTVASSAQTFAGDALATHQHAAVSAGTPAGSNAAEAAHTHTYTDVIAHTHTYTLYNADGSNSTGGSNRRTTTTNGATTASSGIATGTTAAGASHNHAFTGSAMGTHQHAAISAGTPSGTNTPGAATSVVQPYIVVYMFKRTA